MSCAKCEELCQEVPIRSPGELRRAIAVAKANVADGTLIEIIAVSASPLQTGLSELDTSGPWPDIVSADFRCANCGQPFHLSCETSRQRRKLVV